jgi:acyl-CoA thioesterase I
MGAGSSCLREDDSPRMGKLTLRGCGSALAFWLSASVPFAQAPTASAPGNVTKKTIVFLGDSLTAGYGVRADQAFPALIAEKIREADLPFAVVNAGVSGDTSTDGLHRIDWLLQRKIDVLMIALGANDGLRGLSLTALQANLQAIVDKAKAKNPQIKIVIAGMHLPPNLGADYATKFERVFAEVAQKNNTILIPFLLQGVGGQRDLNQPDLIHPTAAGHKVVADGVWQTLQPILLQESAQ